MAARPSVLSIDPCLVVEWIPAGPNGRVAVASDGSIYVSDTNNHRIQKFTSEGVFVNKWGTDGTGYRQFLYPAGVAVASDGSVYVADSVNHRIQKFAPGQ